MPSDLYTGPETNTPQAPADVPVPPPARQAAIDGAPTPTPVDVEPGTPAPAAPEPGRHRPATPVSFEKKRTHRARPQEKAGGERREKREKPKRRHRVLRAIGQVFGVIFVLLLSVVVLLYGVITVICTGPFPTARDLFVVSVEETSAIKFLSRIHFSEDEVQAILAANTVVPPTEVTDTNKPFEPPPETDIPEQDIEIHEVTGSTFVGKMMIVKDPSRVSLVALDSFGSEVRGKRVEVFAEENNATAAINAGWFDDPGGFGLGGQPLGLLIVDGTIRKNGDNTIVGFDEDNYLIVGKMSGAQALERKVRHAVSVHDEIMPPLIINGNPTEFLGSGSGLNPRTAIGQRSDGAVLMLVIDGRQPHSLGATLQDCQRIMMEYDAINACMQDGGSSSVMWYQGEMLNVCSSLSGSRSQPSAWIVS